MGTAEPTAVVAGQKPAGYTLPRSFQLKAIRGALDVEVLRGQEFDRVIVRFANPTVARLRELEVRAALTLPSSEVLVVADSVTRKGPWWPETMYGRIERLAAAAGVILALANYWSVFFAAPNVSLQALPTHNLVAGRSPTISVRVINQADAKATVELSSAHPLRVEPSGLTLEPRQEVIVSAVGLAPATVTSTMAVSGKARSGWFRFARVATAETRLIVWPRERVGDYSAIRVYRSGHAADFTFPLVVGEAAPEGLKCEATVVLVPHATITGAQPARELATQVNSERGNELSFLSWVLGPSEAFTERSIQVILESSVPRTELEWRSAVPRTECKRRSS